MTIEILNTVIAQAEVNGGGFTVGGMIFMFITWSFIIGFTIFCFARVLKSEK